MIVHHQCCDRWKKWFYRPVTPIALPRMSYSICSPLTGVTRCALLCMIAILTTLTPERNREKRFRRDNRLSTFLQDRASRECMSKVQVVTPLRDQLLVKRAIRRNNSMFRHRPDDLQGLDEPCWHWGPGRQKCNWTLNSNPCPASFGRI